MRRTFGIKVALFVVALIVVALSINEFLTPAAGQSAQTPLKPTLKVTLTDVAPGTELPFRFDQDPTWEHTTSPSKETFTVDPSIKYADLTLRLNGRVNVKGKILIEGKIKAEGR